MSSADRAFLRMHVMAVWGVTFPPQFADDFALKSTSHQPHWRLCAADLADLEEGRILIWQAGTTQAQRIRTLERLAALEATEARSRASLPDLSTLARGIQREVALRLDAEPTLSVAEARRVARPVTRDDFELIDAFWPGEADDALLPEAQPVFGVIADGRLASMAHCSRQLAQHCELGVETRPEARRRGYALAATVAWSAAVIADGLTPIYSASAQNTASLALAHAAGYRVVARVATVDDLPDTAA